MSWRGNFTIHYDGKEPKRFMSLVKLVIPNYPYRFKEIPGESTIDCVRRLTWYNAETDLEYIMNCIEDGDVAVMKIVGETRPTNPENGNVLPYEEITFTKTESGVTIQNPYPDYDRYIDESLGVLDDIEHNLEYPDETERETEKCEIDNLNIYMEWLAANFANDDDFIPYILGFLQTIIQEGDFFNADKEFEQDSREMESLRTVVKKLETVETLKEYLGGLNNAGNRFVGKKQHEDMDNIPDFIKNMNQDDVKLLGGIDVLMKLVEKKGENGAAKMLKLMGY